MDLLARAATPLIKVLSLAPRGLLWLLGGSQQKDDKISEDIKTMPVLGSEEGSISEDEKDINHSAVEFGAITVDEIMVPRVEIAGVEIGTPLEEVLDRVVETGHSLIPVYRDSLDGIVGVLYARDLLAAWRNEGRFALQELVRPPFFASRHQKVSDLFREFRDRALRMGIVGVGNITHSPQGSYIA